MWGVPSGARQGCADWLLDTFQSGMGQLLLYRTQPFLECMESL
jgi:hypothetical protein